MMLMLPLFMAAASSCVPAEAKPEPKAWAWMVGNLTLTDDDWEYYFSHAEQAGIDAILLECHHGVPDPAWLKEDFVGYEAIEIIKTALPYAQKHHVELHAWVWTENRGEITLREAHPEWYMVNRNGESVTVNKLYGREHYRFLCPYQPGVVEYLKDRAAEIAEIEGLAGVHMDFIRYPDVILPNKLQPSRGVVQDKEYPEWDHCYCDVCRALFKEQTGIDPLDLEDPSQNEAWKKFRYDGIVRTASEFAKTVKEHGKISSAAVFPHPDTARKLVRQDWPRWENVDYFFPMVYHLYYVDRDNPEWITVATQAGVDELKANNNPATEVTGLFVGHVPVDSIPQMIKFATDGGSTGICFFSLEAVRRADMRGIPYWEKLGEAIAELKKR